MFTVVFKTRVAGQEQFATETHDRTEVDDAKEKYHDLLHYGYNQRRNLDYFMAAILDADAYVVEREIWRDNSVEDSDGGEE